MTETHLTATRIRAGIWEGVMTGPQTLPAIRVTWLDKPLADVTVTAMPDLPRGWAVRIPIPTEALNEGVQTFLVQDAANGTILSHFTVTVGVTAEHDLRAELDLLRAELDMLKRAFRRHCVETAA